MACKSCGGSSVSRVGSTINTAIVFGEPNNEVYRVRVTGSIQGIQTGAVKYVRGAGVQDLVASGDMHILAGGPYQPSLPAGYTLYYVGDIGYTTMDAARVRSGQTGEEVVVRTFGQ